MTHQSITNACFQSYEEQQRRRRALQPGVNAHNKSAIFSALSACDVTSIVVTFDGYGDSGQLDEPCYFRGDEAVEEPALQVEIQKVLADGSGVETRALPVREAVEGICYALLREHHPGWENNDGAFGEFKFDVAEDVIRYSHSSRYTEVDTSDYAI